MIHVLVIDSSMEQGGLQPNSIFDHIGHAGFKRLVDGFYARVAADDVLRPMYPEEDLQPAARRLQLFLEQYFGGPTTYAQERGHPRLRARHMPFPIDEDARDRWLTHMLAALHAADFSEEIVAVMQDYFERGAAFLVNRPPTAGGMFATSFQPKE